MNYYNEFDPFAAGWLRKLIAAGHLPAGDVDGRDIRDVIPDELTRYTQYHFFAGIGGWSRALKLAGWPDNRPVWTGSAPCQPFSAAGKRAGIADERHLWPAWFWLIRQCRPPVIFGEQVAGKAGRHWLAIVQADLEAAGYAVGRAVVSAAGAGAPQGRHRIWFVADAKRERLQRQQQSRAAARATNRSSYWDKVDWLPHVDGKALPVESGTFPLANGIPARVGRLRGYGNAIVPQVAAEFIGAYMECANGLD